MAGTIFYAYKSNKSIVVVLYPGQRQLSRHLMNTPGIRTMVDGFEKDTSAVKVPYKAICDILKSRFDIQRLRHENKNLIIGHQIVNIEQLSEIDSEELSELTGTMLANGQRVTVMKLSNGNMVYAVGDDEGNTFADYGFQVIEDGDINEDNLYTVYPIEDSNA